MSSSSALSQLRSPLSVPNTRQRKPSPDLVQFFALSAVRPLCCRSRNRSFFSIPTRRRQKWSQDSFAVLTLSPHSPGVVIDVVPDVDPAARCTRTGHVTETLERDD